MDPDGYDAYRVERRFSPIKQSDWESSQQDSRDLHSPNRFDRRGGLTDEQAERVRGGGWDLPTLQSVVDQFVIHYDAAGTSRSCFQILHDSRGLSVHFMLDLDGTLYQTLDLKERAWHATTSNSRSIGIEIANRGAYASNENDLTKGWYQKDATGTFITIPPQYGTNSQRTPHFVGRPARSELVQGEIQGKMLQQYDLTSQQYEALTKLTATLCTVFPKLTCDYPRDPSGHLITAKLPDDVLANYHGVLGHFHIQTNKVDPGPAFQWDTVINGARKQMR
jgi:N-acetyl-anhydromuramyl-L-alanine amidase AmpD